MARTRPATTAKDLRARRYRTDRNDDLAQYILHNLPYLDYAETLEWYDTIRPCLTPPDWALLGANDRYYLVVELLKRKDMRHPWIFDRCRELERQPDGYLDLWARYHGKSSLGTTAGIIQEVVIDPEITVAIFSHTKPIAKAFLAQIKRELEENEALKAAYRDVLFAAPRRESPKWSEEEGIIVKRRSNPREATIEAHGLVDGQPVSRHYRLLVYDDIVTDKSVTTPEQIRKTTLAWEQSDNLGAAEGVRKWTFGTRWSFGDSYGIILERKVLKERRYPATDDGTLSGAPVFLTRERWEEVKRTQRSTLSAQMLLNPVAGNDAVFLSTWFCSYEVFPSVLNVYILVDPSKGRSRAAGGHDSDRSAIAVIGIDHAGNKYLLDGYCHRMRFSERYAYLKRLYAKWSAHPGVQIVKVGYERYGAQIDTEVIEEMQAREQNYFEVHELGFPRQGAHSKRDRIERLEPDIRAGRFYFPAVVWHPDFGGLDNECTWSVWTEADQKEFDKRRAEGAEVEAEKLRCSYNIGQIIHRPLRGLTRAQRYCEVTAQKYRIVRAIRRLNEDRDVYDLTRIFIEEARFFPFAPHDDLIDAAARIYDIEPTPPVVHEAISAEGLWDDGADPATYDA